MLVLSRKSHETVVVGDANGFQHILKVTVLGIRGKTVTLGFDVDGNVPVNRLEVWERLHGKASSLPF